MSTEDLFNAAMADTDQAEALRVLDAAVRERGFRQVEAAGGGEQSTIRKALYAGSNPGLSTLAAIVGALGYQIALIPKNKQ